jgi:hypothetical protein
MYDIGQSLSLRTNIEQRGEDRCWTLNELVKNTGISGYFIRQVLKMHTFAVKWVPWVPHVFEVQRWTLYGTWRINMEGFEREGDNFFNRTIVIDETLARAYK